MFNLGVGSLWLPGHMVCVSRWGRSAYQGPEGGTGSDGPPGTARDEGWHGSTGAPGWKRPARGEGESLQSLKPTEILLLLQTDDISSTRGRHCHGLQQVSAATVRELQTNEEVNRKTRCLTVAVSQFRVCVLWRTRSLWCLKASPSETLLTSAAVVKCGGRASGAFPGCVTRCFILTSWFLPPRPTKVTIYATWCRHFLYFILLFRRSKNLGICEAMKDRNNTSSRNREKKEHVVEPSHDVVT